MCACVHHFSMQRFSCMIHFYVNFYLLPFVRFFFVFLSLLSLTFPYFFLSSPFSFFSSFTFSYFLFLYLFSFCSRFRLLFLIFLSFLPSVILTSIVFFFIGIFSRLSNSHFLSPILNLSLQTHVFDLIKCNFYTNKTFCFS